MADDQQVLDEELQDVESEAQKADRERRERAAHLADLDLADLLSEATDSELAAEQLRCSKAMSKLSTRGLGISHEIALERLDRGLARLPAYRRQALDGVKRDALKRPDGVHVESLVALAAVLYAERNLTDLREVAAEVLIPDGKAIHETSPTRPINAERRRLDERAAEAGVELQRRDVERRAAGLPSRPKKGKK